MDPWGHWCSHQPAAPYGHTRPLRYVVTPRGAVLDGIHARSHPSETKFALPLRPVADHLSGGAVACVAGDPVRHSHELKPLLLTDLFTCRLAGDDGRCTVAFGLPGASTLASRERQRPADFAAPAGLC